MESSSVSLLVQTLKAELLAISTEQKAAASRRYFPQGVEVIGATAADIKAVAKSFHANHLLTAEQTLAVTEQLLAQAKFSEEKLLAFALLNKFVARHFDESLFQRFEFWLEHYADNWSLVDDLCIKTIYQFLLKRPHLIEHTQHWSQSKVSWCRRASCVVWVKFIERKIGKAVYRLNPELVFDNCQRLINDDDEFVQKGVGWLLKVTAVHHPEKVTAFIKQNIKRLERSTLRYAIEKFDKATRQQILAW